MTFSWVDILFFPIFGKLLRRWCPGLVPIPCPSLGFGGLGWIVGARGGFLICCAYCRFFALCGGCASCLFRGTLISVGWCSYRGWWFPSAVSIVVGGVGAWCPGVVPWSFPGWWCFPGSAFWSVVAAGMLASWGWCLFSLFVALGWSIPFGLGWWCSFPGCQRSWPPWLVACVAWWCFMSASGSVVVVVVLLSWASCCLSSFLCVRSMGLGLFVYRFPPVCCAVSIAIISVCWLLFPDCLLGWFGSLLASGFHCFSAVPFFRVTFLMVVCSLSSSSLVVSVSVSLSGDVLDSSGRSVGPSWRRNLHVLPRLHSPLA